MIRIFGLCARHWSVVILKRAASPCLWTSAVQLLMMFLYDLCDTVVIKRHSVAHPMQPGV